MSGRVPGAPAPDEASILPRVRKVAPSEPFCWLAKGWDDFRHAWRSSIFYGVVFALMGWLIVLVFRNAYEYVWGLTTGFLLVGPFFATGIYELSRQRERGEATMLAPTIDIWRPNLGSIGMFALVLGVLLLVWARASLVDIALSFPDEMPSLQGFMRNALSPRNLEFVLALILLLFSLAGCIQGGGGTAEAVPLQPTAFLQPTSAIQTVAIAHRHTCGTRCDGCQSGGRTGDGRNRRTSQARPMGRIEGPALRLCPGSALLVGGLAHPGGRSGWSDDAEELR